MENPDFEALLVKKEELLRMVSSASIEINKQIKSKAFENALQADLEKNEFINSLFALDKELVLAAKTTPVISEKARQIIKNINSSLIDLIKLEKENELLISQAGESISGKYIDSYKTYKQLK